MVKDSLTDTASLRCSLNDTSSLSSVIGRRDVIATTQTDDVITRRDVTWSKMTSGNVNKITSITVTQAGKDVASVSTAHPVKATDLGVTVTGGFSDTSMERG